MREGAAPVRRRLLLSYAVLERDAHQRVDGA